MTFRGPGAEAGLDLARTGLALQALQELASHAGRLFYGPHGSLQARLWDVRRAQGLTVTVSLDLVLEGGVLDLASGRPIHPDAALDQVVDTLLEVLAVRRTLAGRRVQGLSSRGQKVCLHLPQGEELQVEEPVARLLASRQVAALWARCLEPLRLPGVEEVVVARPGGRQEHLSREEMAYVDPPSPRAQPMGEERQRMLLSPVAVAFKQDNKWRLAAGEETLFATVEDQAFLERVERGESFSKGDLLVCDVCVRRWQDEDGVRTEYAIVRVWEHRRPARQMTLPLTVGGGIP